MISSAAISQAVNLCSISNIRFSEIGPRCFSYLETAGLLGYLNSPQEVDELFLDLLKSELEDDADDLAFDRNQSVWANA